MKKAQGQTGCSRAYRRYMIKEGVYVAFPGKSNQCSLLDISLGGIAFQCRYKGEIPCNVNRIDIVVDGDVFLEEILFANISDSCQVDSNYKPIRRRSGRFESLAPHQQIGLQQLIEQFSLKEIS